jgi:hypothetical protein
LKTTLNDSAQTSPRNITQRKGTTKSPFASHESSFT